MASLQLTGWQQEILLRLQERDAAERANAALYDGYRRLAAQAALLKERNRSLLKAASASRQVSAAVAGSSSNNSGSEGDNPVRQAYVQSLEAQIASLRDELGSVYKTQAQNAQRLVNLTEQLQSNNDRFSTEHTELLQLRSERAISKREREEALQLRKDKDRSIEALQDELSMLKLEFDMLEKKNEDLREDNSSLLRRWLEKKAQEAAEMDGMLEK